MKKIYLYILVVLVMMPISAKAVEYTLLEPLPCIADTGNNCADGKTIPTINLDTYIGYIFKFSIALAAFLAVIMIIYGGFEYMLTESFSGKGAGIKKVQNALTGLLMVLASYLILRTIDPRLVEINTTIEPIKIDTKEVTDFLSALSTDLKNLSQEKQQEIKNLLSDKDAKETRIFEIEKILYDNTERGGLTKKEIDDLLLEQGTLKDQVTKLDANISSTIAQGTGLIQFNSALGSLGAESNYTENYNAQQKSTGRTFLIMNGDLSKTVETDVANAKLIIETKYKEYINNAASDPENIQVLIKQKEYFIKQIDEQADLMQSVIAYKKSDVLLDGNMGAYRNIVRPYLEKTLTDYQKEYDSPKAVVPAGMEDQYRQLTGSRIEVIREALKPK